MRCLSCGMLLVALMLSAAEPAGTPLFNGKDLTGWKTKTGEALDGKTEAYNGRFKVVEGELVIDPKVKGDVILYTAREFSGDTRITFEFFPGPTCNNDLFFRGLKFDLVKGNVKNFKPDQWHRFEIAVKGDTAEFKCNGELQRTQKTKTAKSTLGLRAEFGALRVRNLRVEGGS